MSQEPQDLLEEALRSDLPSAETEARLRRRLLAAGLALGQGVATGTAAGAAASTTAGAGVAGAVQATGVSWAVKVGLFALVAAPAVGALVQSSEPKPVAQPVVVEQAPRSAPGSPLPQTTSETQALPTPEPTPEPPRVRAAPTALRAARPASEAPVGAEVVAPATALPSQGAFAKEVPPSEAKPQGTTLAEETRLLDAAFAALAASDRVRAAALVAEHEARYPSGLLRRERERAKRRLSELSRGE